MTKLTKQAWFKNVVERAAWTFAETFVAVFGVGLVNVLDAFHKGISGGKSALLALVASAVAAAVSAVKTTVQSARVGT